MRSEAPVEVSSTGGFVGAVLAHGRRFRLKQSTAGVFDCRSGSSNEMGSSIRTGPNE